MFEVIFPISVLISGLAVLVISSDKAVKHSIHLASALGISSLMIGLLLASVGTDLPEIANSIISCSSGHGDIDLGDSIGSILTQITLILGIIALLGRGFKVKRKEILVIGAAELVALTAAISVGLIGFTRERAFLLMANWPILILIIGRVVKQDITKEREHKKREERHIITHLTIAILGFVGVAVGALAVVRSVIMLSDTLRIPEFFISFFVLGVGTSIPELVVDFTAIRRRQYEFAIGDILGSCIVDATISVSIGQFLFPTPVFVEPTGRSILLALYTIIASATVILTLALRKKVDKKAGILFVLVYGVSYILFFL